MLIFICSRNLYLFKYTTFKDEWFRVKKKITPIFTGQLNNRIKIGM